MQRRRGKWGSEMGGSSDGRENLRRYVGGFWFRQNTQETSAAFLNLEKANIGGLYPLRALRQSQIQIAKGFVGGRR